MQNRDFIPVNWNKFALWILNFNQHLPVLAAKYGITAEILAQAAADAAWARFYVKTLFAARAQQRQLLSYIKTVTNEMPDETVPNAPVWKLLDDAPEVPKGVKARAREIANRIKSQKSIYTTADGNLLGIVMKEELNRPEAEHMPVLKVSAGAAFKIHFSFRKQGSHAVRFEYRRKGGEWTHLGDAAKSPAEFAVPPETPDTPEQIQIRAIFLKNYQPFGSYSPSYPVVVAP